MRKLVQRQVFSFLGTRWGIAVCLLGALFTINAALQLSWQIVSKGRARCSEAFVDNIGGHSYETDLCAPVPIDVVYTWVNGSDPKLHEAIAVWKEVHRREFPDAFKAPPPRPPPPFRGGMTSRRASPPVAPPPPTHVNTTDELELGIANVTAAWGTRMNTSTNAAAANATSGAASSSRFRDNNELRYSLRSIEKFAPWVRNIYLVTNGQIPSWLNLDHPRVHVVSHADIFQNASHLPTFSSPAIEVHLHRIPGISDTFIYLNDDVMFGREVWPDDFLTPSGGQKVYLAWPVPNCNDGCPASWINDGVCDSACNVTSCDFDGRDCMNATASGRHGNWWAGNNAGGGAGAGRGAWGTSRFAAYCAPGCPDSWIGDRYCDKACTNAACGWDATDCGLELMQSSLFGINATWAAAPVAIPLGAPAMFVNLSHIFAGGHIVEGSHDNSDMVRTATISQRHKIMTLTFKRNVTMQAVELLVVGKLSEDADAPSVEWSLNITVSTLDVWTSPPPAEAPPPPPLSLASALGLEAADVTNGEHTADGANAGADAGAEADAHAEAEADAHAEAVADAHVEADAGNGDENQTTTAAAAGVHSNAEGQADDGQNEGNSAGDATDHNAVPAAEPPPQSAMDAAAADAPSPTDLRPRHAMRKLAALPNGNAAVGDVEQWSRATGHASRFLEGAPERQPIAVRPADAPFAAPVESCLVRVAVSSVAEPAAARACTREPDDRALLDAIEAGKRKWLEHEQEEAAHALLRGANAYAHERQVADAMMRSTRSPLPWERQKSLLAQLWLGDASAHLLSEGAASGARARPGQPAMGRRMLDLFADSLKHVNRIYNRVYKQTARKVPAHMPHLIRRNVMERLQARFASEFLTTSSHRFRHPDDMQYAFSYFYFLMHEPVALDLRGYFHKYIDTDGNGVISDNELRSLVTRVYTLPLGRRELREAHAALNATAHALYGARAEHRYDFAVLAATPLLSDKIRALLRDTPGEKFSIEPITEIAFQMIGENETDVNRALDEIRRYRNKFVCLNDDMGDEANPLVVQALQDFYSSLLPNASAFELPPGKRNAYLYLDDFRKAERWARVVRASGIGLTVGLVLVWCWLYGPCAPSSAKASASERKRMLAV